MTGTVACQLKPARVSREGALWRVGVSGSLLALLAFLPIPIQPRLSLCGFLWLTGRPCPLCGLTRALACLLRGDLALAASLHPLSPLVLVVLLSLFLGGLWRIVSERTGWPTPLNRSFRFFRTASVWSFVAFGAWRIWMDTLS